VLAGLVVHPFAGAKALLAEYRRLTARAPEEMTCWVVMRKAPPLPFLPPEVHGREVVVLAMCHVGDRATAERDAAPFRALGRPIADVVGPMPLVAWQAAFDPLLAPGARNYWKSHSFRELNDGLLDVLLEHVGRLPSDDCEVFLGHLGGAINRVPVAATAYPHRDVEFIANVHTRWSAAHADAACVAWARSLYAAMTPFSTGGVYVNFMPEDERDRVRAGAYGTNYDRLARLKGRYDPDNLFCMNQNVSPVLAS